MFFRVLLLPGAKIQAVSQSIVCQTASPLVKHRHYCQLSLHLSDLLDICIRAETTIRTNQFGFRRGHSTMLIRLHLFLWDSTQNHIANSPYIRIMRDMYRGAKTMVKASSGNGNGFPVRVSVPHSLGPPSFSSCCWTAS